MNMAIKFVNLQSSDLRNPDVLGQLLADTITPTLPTIAPDPTAAYNTSVERRAEIDLNPINENVYDQQIDPKRVKQFAIELLNATGIESELGEDITVNATTSTTVNVEDPSIRPIWEEQPTSASETAAIAIAQKLGLNLSPPISYNQNLVIPGPYAVDSTDPYIRKVMGV
jgi:hypothetical protein